MGEHTVNPQTLSRELEETTRNSLTEQYLAGSTQAGEDVELPPRWEGDKIEGEVVTVAGTPRVHLMRRERAPPQKRTRPASMATTKRQNPLMVHGVRTCPRCLVGPGREKGGKHYGHDRETYISTIDDTYNTLVHNT